jgi:hypothetical protein
MVDAMMPAPLRYALFALRQVVIHYGQLLLLLAVLCLAVLTGCMSVPFAGDMTEGQLNALAADDKTRVKCYEIPTPYGRARVAVVYMDKDAQQRGSVMIEGECKVTVNHGPSK